MFIPLPSPERKNKIVDIKVDRITHIEDGIFENNCIVHIDSGKKVQVNMDRNDVVMEIEDIKEQN